jgi:hypothetical protein
VNVSKQSIDVYIIMNESGEFVVADDEDKVVGLAEEEFEHDDLRQVRVKVTMSPANGRQPPAIATVEID